MDSNFFLSICIFLISFDVSYGQVNCAYRNNDSYGYTCELTIKNPNGLNNFASIGGTHMSGKTNNDVLRVLRVIGSNTTNIPSIICDKFQSLIYFQLYEIGIKTVDDKAFKNCKKLQYLYIDRNQINSVHENAFVENSALRYLHLGYNQLSALSENVLRNQQNLAYLIIHVNKLPDLPKYIFRSLRKLIYLDICINQIKTLRVEWFLTLEALETLYLYSNQIEVLPRNIFSPLEKLNQILLNNNKIKIIPSNAFQSHPNLKTVELYNNQIEAMEESFINKIGVQTLDFRNNICANQSIFDNSTAKMLIRVTLKDCFENFDNSLSARVSKLETSNEELQDQNSQLTITTNEMQSKVNNITAEIAEIRSENQRLSTVTEELIKQIQDLRLDVDANARKIGEIHGIFTNKTIDLEAQIEILTSENKNQSSLISNQGLIIAEIQVENQILREEAGELRDQIVDLLKENDVQNLTIENQGSQITELQESSENQAKKLDDLQYQIYELSNRPCACK